MCLAGAHVNLDQTNLYLNENESEGEGHAGVAVREGEEDDEEVCCWDTSRILLDRTFVPFLCLFDNATIGQQHKACGYPSCILLPLHEH
jgi:hypothetical protein